MIYLTFKAIVEKSSSEDASEDVQTKNVRLLISDELRGLVGS